jgi:trigger factor
MKDHRTMSLNEDQTTAENENPDTSARETAVAEAEGVEPEEFRLSLSVDIQDTGPCKKHVRITIPQSDVSHFLEEEIGGMVDKASVPGFRVGHVPRKLVELRFRQELNDQVKQKMLIQSLEQVAEDYDLDPINEPDIDLENIDLAQEGDFVYEFDVEVRPTFDLPDYQGLTIKRSVREINDEDIDAYQNRFLMQYSQLVPCEEAAEVGDSLSMGIEFQHNGETLHKISELSVRVLPTLRFYDAELGEFDKLMVGVQAEENREADLTISTEAESVEMRGETVKAVFNVHDVKRVRMPEMNKEFLQRVGVETEEELREEIRATLERQVTYQQRQSTREQVLEKITESADWELPEDLVLRQVENALRREILEMQQAGFTSPEIQARENELRQKAVSTTRRALKEHFVLDKIAITEDISVGATDIEFEIQMMSTQRGESPRRVRARLQKSGMIENLEAQIRERKAVDFILSKAEFNDVPMEKPNEDRVEAVPHSVCGMTIEPEAVSGQEDN